MPAEWERHMAVQLTWPHDDTDWQPILDEITGTYVEMAVAIASRERLIVVTPKPEEVAEQLKRAGMKEEALARTDIIACNTDDTWARDHGFITLSDDTYTDDSTQKTEERTEKSRHLYLLDFCFNGWGRKFEAEQDNAINRQLFAAGAVEGEYENHLDFVLEGGSIESDGQGTIFTTTGCLMAPNRNQPLTRLQIEEQLKRRLHADRVVWLDYGSLAGDDTDGHIDTLVRIAPHNTLLYIGCDNPEDEHYEELALMERQLKTLKTADGQPYRLLRLPLPEPIYDDGDRLPATYANYLVLNNAVLCPTYGQPELDKVAMETIAKAFTDREIVGIDCRSIIRQHGSLHCCTMQIYSQTDF